MVVVRVTVFYGIGRLKSAVNGEKGMRTHLEIDILDKLDASLSRLVEFDGLD